MRLPSYMNLLLGCSILLLLFVSATVQCSLMVRMETFLVIQAIFQTSAEGLSSFGEKSIAEQQERTTTC